MRKTCFRLLARLNKLLLPKVGYPGSTRLTAAHKALLAWRYWVTCNAL
jgi:hypothetical protein